MSRNQEDVMDTGEPTIVLVPKPDRRESVLQQMSEAWSGIPALRLSPQDVQVRWSLDASTCYQLLDTLVDLKVITRNEDGTYWTAA